MAVLNEPASLPQLSDYRRFARRHRAVMGLLTCLGLLFGLAQSTTHPVTFSATATLALTPVPKYLAPLSTQIAPPEVTIDTDAQLLQSVPVRNAMARALGTDADAAAAALSVTATANSNVLHVTVKARTAQAAADAANAAATALIDVRRRDLGSIQAVQVRQLRAVVRAQELMLADEQSRTIIIPAADSIFAELLTVKATVKEVQEARKTPADIVDPAVAPAHHDYANTQVPIVSGGMLGFLGAVLIGVARDRRRRVRPHITAERLTRPFDAQPGAATRHKDHHYV